MLIPESWVGQRLSAYSGGSASSAQPEPPSMAPYIGGHRGGAAQKGVASSVAAGSSSCVAATSPPVEALSKRHRKTPSKTVS